MTNEEETEIEETSKKVEIKPAPELKENAFFETERKGD